mgnify:FL=1
MLDHKEENYCCCGVKHILPVNEKLIREGYNECNKG